jgi:hypothetical protein
MDLLTRGAGFGYIGSTITSLIYASFTFIFFALEAAVMAYALELAFDMPPAWGYLICALVVIPLVTHGVTAISRLQVWTQPLWLVMLIVPYVVVFQHHPDILPAWPPTPARTARHRRLRPAGLRRRTTVGIALITQMGEQVDYLRFMPERTAANRGRWWLGVLAGGPGWVILGVLKMLGGALLAYLAITHMVPPDRAVDPNQMYLAAYELRVPALRLGGGGHRALRLRLAAQDQRHQRLRRLAGLEQLLLPADAQPPRARGVDGVQHRHRAAADGDERVLRRSARCWGCTPTSPSPG